MLLESLFGPGRRFIAPQGVDQGVGAGQPRCLQREAGEHRGLAGAGHRDGSAVDVRNHRTQQGDS